jgi:hypothetical protein
MGEGRPADVSADTSADGEWLTIPAAARRLGVSPRAIRGRITRSTIEWKPAGNVGKLVLVRSGETSADASADAFEDEADQLREELMEARERAARAEGELAGVRQALEREWALVEQERVRADRLEAEATKLRDRAGTAEGEAGALRDALIDLSQRLDTATAALVEAHRPWWRRLLG